MSKECGRNGSARGAVENLERFSFRLAKVSRERWERVRDDGEPAFGRVRPRIRESLRRNVIHLK